MDGGVDGGHGGSERAVVGARKRNVTEGSGGTVGGDCGANTITRDSA